MSEPARRRFTPGTTAEDLKAYMAPFAGRLGYRFSDDDEFVAAVLAGEIELIDREGDAWCPCRLRPSDVKEHPKYACPCIPFYTDEFWAARQCWCGLFVRHDVPDGEALHGEWEVPPGPTETRVAEVDDLVDGQAKTVWVGPHEIALFRVDGEFYALSSRCRHMYAPLGAGYLDGYYVMCPWHGWRYDVRDGTTDHPDADVRTYAVTVRGGEVFVTA